MNATESSLLVAADGDIVTWTLNRPAVRNAVNLALLELLDAELDALRRNPPRVLILGATAPGFCAGIDLKESRDASAEFAHVRVTLMHQVLDKLRRFPSPVITAIDGACAGLGAELAISGDLRVASPTSRFGYPEPRVAVPSPSHHLISLVGLARAQDLLLTARWVPAPEAESFGIVSRIAVDADTAAQELAAQVAKLAPRSLMLTKENMNLSIRAGAEAASRHHIDGVTSSAWTSDRAEALAAFAERREPSFTGS
ncbi:MAG TPA: enoyl-CoA hydratase/isomerase family protein [Thermomicrobiales bacterium]|nr:enoyl-CoA hydratase/isomerase family protein [Thermomicrobiales bacterium]